MTPSLRNAQMRLTTAIIQLQSSIRANERGLTSAPLQTQPALQTPTQGPVGPNTTLAPRAPINSTISPAQPDLVTLQYQLGSFEQQLKHRAQWIVPQDFRPDPSLEIDLSDLDDAIARLKIAVESPNFVQENHTPQPVFSKQSWLWDDIWCEWYYVEADSESFIYLNVWELDDFDHEWVHVPQVNVSMEDALADLGCWEDWLWDGAWGEWYLPLDDIDGRIRRFYASEWRKDCDGNWTYIETRQARG